MICLKGIEKGEVVFVVPAVCIFAAEVVTIRTDHGGVFLYKGKSYFHRWGYGKSSRWFTYKADYTNEPRITIAESTDGAFGDSFGKVKVCDIGYREY